METHPPEQAVIQSISHFIAKKFPKARQKGLEFTTPLIESGIVDSLGILDLVGFLESEFNIVVSDEDLVPENFQTVARIGAYVQTRRGGAGAA